MVGSAQPITRVGANFKYMYFYLIKGCFSQEIMPILRPKILGVNKIKCKTEGFLNNQLKNRGALMPSHPCVWSCHKMWTSKKIAVFFTSLYSAGKMRHLVIKSTKWHVRPAKTQISLGIHPVWSESLLCTQWVAKDPRFLHADSKDSDQTRPGVNYFEM